MPHPTAGSVKMAPRSCPNTPTHSSRSPKFPPHKHSGSPPFSWQPPLLCITFAGGRAGMEPARKGAVKEGAPLRQPMLGATLPSARPAAFLSTHTPTCTHPHAHTHMHTHTHTHMHTHTPTCTHTRTHTCTRTHPHAHTHTHTPTCTHPHAHAHTHMHTHTHTPTCTHPHAHTHMHTHTPTCTHTHTHTHTHTPTCTHPHAHAHTHMHTHTHTHTPTCTHARTRTHPHAHTHAHAHTHMHTPTCTRTHPHAHAHTHMHTHTHTHAHAHTHMHTPTCTRTHTHAHTRTHTCTRTHPHAHTHTHAHAHAHTCTHMHTPTCTRTHPHAHTHTHAHAHAHTCTHMHTPTHAHTHTPTCTHAHMHTCTCTHAHAHMHTHMHTHTHAHTHTHTRTCTHTHTHTRWDGTMGLAGGVGVGCSCTVNWSPSQIKGWMELVPGGLSPSTASVSAPRPVTRNPAAGSLLLYEAGPGRCCGDLRGVRGHRSPTRAGPGTGRNLQERHGAPRRGPARELSSHGESLRVPAPDRQGCLCLWTGPEELERCLFAETLEVVAAGSPPGEQRGAQWWVAAQWAPYEQPGEPVSSCLLVQAHGRQDGVPGSKTLKAYVTPQLETLEQEEQERLERALGIQWQTVGSVEMEVFVIERTLHSGTGISTVSHSSFLPSGHLARLVQVGCPVVMLLQDASVLTETGGIKPRPHFAKQPLQWEEDIQLYSWFLDRKEELRASYTSYVQQHPELKAQMADFLLTLLLQRPHDSVSFATQFFTSLACQQPPGSPFASAEAARPLPSPPPHHSPANRE
ncbi:ciliogenesis-associated TTC17-interacting protein isoform X3 [Pogoniulus pusillus]|uniref:ciliogenesis-associated TTC17-interacting protein isoform X3 n=1 Tax=Pogoniulus pusillus TaxID=488313 RepID=UPI0030B9232A